MTPSLLNEGALINGRYTVVRQVGRGGMGAVYEATDTRLGNRVALKQTLEIAIFEPDGRQIASIGKASAVFDMVFTDAGDLLTVSAQGEVVLYDLP